MLRRHLPLGNHPERWLLVSQVEHARLSCDLANHWGNGQVPAVFSATESTLAPLRHEWLAAVHHHDDGWGSWEADPAIDPEEGRPYSFLDMPRAATLDIWRDSVHFARRYGPLAGWWVARHFSVLLQGSPDVDELPSQRWLAEIEAVSTPWLSQWLAGSPERHRDIAERGLAGLKFFDWLSLWFCLECPGVREEGAGEPGQMAPDWEESPVVEFTASATQERGSPRQVVVQPWPFDVPDLSLEIMGYAIPAARYVDEGEMIERRVPFPLVWQLVPAE